MSTSKKKHRSKAKSAKARRQQAAARKTSKAIERKGSTENRSPAQETATPPAARLSGFSITVGKRRYDLAPVHACIGLLALLVTAAGWSLLAARIQQGNADQTVNTYLFTHWSTFHAATLPGAHSFLLKWPLFVLANLLGATHATFAFLTCLVTLTTVSALAYVLYRIDRRPLLFGTYCLALASILLAIPPEPYAGGLLPVNMAMLTTRNIEYIVYIVGLVLCIRAPRLKAGGFWWGGLLLGMLFASDKLFATLSIGGAALALISYGIRGKRKLVRLSLIWLLCSGFALAIADIVLWSIGAAHLTHIATQSGTSPYPAATGVKDIALGVIFGCLGILTNFGANPAFDAAVLRKIPSLAYGRLASLSGFAFVMNGLLCITGLYATARLLGTSLFHSKDRQPRLDMPVVLSLFLIWSSLAACGAFIATHHYYVVDARYLSILLFAVFVSTVTYFRGKALHRGLFAPLSVMLVVSISCGTITAIRIYKQDRQALADVSTRNALVAKALINHPVSVLVGDYWRVLPIKDSASHGLNVMPLDACNQPRGILSSATWQPDLSTHSFAYLLSFDKSLTNYPNCSLTQVMQAYGRPNASVTIAGTLEHPTEMLLYYDHGAHKSAPQLATSASHSVPSTVLPISLEELPIEHCEGGATIMNVVAHQDDDLLFISPDLLHDIQAKHCVRTVYVTAGDGGGDQLYWQAREQGSEAAYSTMLGVDNGWVQHIVKLGDHEFATVVNPRGNKQVSLIFLHLPDGNVSGQGFRASDFESLARLEGDRINTMHSVDHQSIYTSTSLVSALTELMQAYHPTEIRTQATYNASKMYQDHSDHMAVGRYTQKAYVAYADEGTTIEFYYGYPIHGMVPNIAPDDLAQKTAAFMAYAKFDGAACHNVDQCEYSSNYGPYLKRQYGYTEH